MKIAASDRALLALLQENARCPTSELARKLGVSRTTVQNRLDRLIDAGVITGFTAKLSSEYQSSLITVLVSIVAAPKANELIIAALRGIPEIRKISSVNGTYDFVVEMTVESVAGIDRILDRIGAVEGVDRTTSMIVLSVKFER